MSPSRKPPAVRVILERRQAPWYIRHWRWWFYPLGFLFLIWALPLIQQ